MRVITGYLGGRHVDAPAGHRTHPMSEKARGGLFNALGDINGLSVLDAYAGSGAISIEAISRGADSSIAIDNDRQAVETITENLKSLGIKEKVKPTRANITGWSENNPGATFDIVIADPPYDQVKIEQLVKISKHTRTGGIFVLSLPAKQDVLDFDGTELIKISDYGDAQLVFYRRIS